MEFSAEITAKEPTPLTVGDTFTSGSKYRLLEPLGRGGMGEVWRAERISAAGHKQVVAVKFLTDFGAEQSSLAAEALRMSCLTHDNIVPFLDSGFDSAGRTFVAMAFVQGMDLDGLKELVGMTPEAAYSENATQRIPDQIVGFILFMTLRALSYAHSFPFGDGVVGLIHRDVSPGNILLDAERGFVKLSDFGVAAVQGDEDGPGQMTGKVPYMAPEVLLQDPVDARTDLYALGLVGYELLTGFNPNIRPHAMTSVIGAITEVMLSLDCPLRAPHEVVEGVSPVISEIIAKMLAKSPSGRFASADQALDALSVYLFDKGFGPTTGSLAAYLSLVSSEGMPLGDAPEHSLRFLDWSVGKEALRPPRRLLPDAAAALAGGKNPSRIDD